MMSETLIIIKSSANDLALLDVSSVTITILESMSFKMNLKRSSG